MIISLGLDVGEDIVTVGFDGDTYYVEGASGLSYEELVEFRDIVDEVLNKGDLKEPVVDQFDLGYDAGYAQGTLDAAPPDEELESAYIVYLDFKHCGRNYFGAKTGNGEFEYECEENRFHAAIFTLGEAEKLKEAWDKSHTTPMTIEEF